MTMRHVIVLVSLLLAGCASSAPVNRDDDNPSNQQAASIEDLVDGEILKRFPGVRTYRAIDGIHLRIRGSHREPLYVVDGVVLTAARGGALWGISPYEIEKVEVVKDPARLAQYGIRGANGAVLITTKRP